MVATALKEGTDTELRTLLGLVVDTIGDTLSSGAHVTIDAVGRYLKERGG